MFCKKASLGRSWTLNHRCFPPGHLSDLHIPDSTMPCRSYSTCSGCAAESKSTCSPVRYTSSLSTPQISRSGRRVDFLSSAVAWGRRLDIERARCCTTSLSLEPLSVQPFVDLTVSVMAPTSTSTSTTPATMPRRQSCDRCHGQKLRCTRTGHGDRDACNRCSSRRAVCI